MVLRDDNERWEEGRGTGAGRAVGLGLYTKVTKVGYRSGMGGLVRSPLAGARAGGERGNVITRASCLLQKK